MPKEKWGYRLYKRSKAPRGKGIWTEVNTWSFYGGAESKRKELIHVHPNIQTRIAKVRI
jgi:hypothetical protein